LSDLAIDDEDLREINDEIDKGISPEQTKFKDTEKSKLDEKQNLLKAKMHDRFLIMQLRAKQACETP
jgi:hypothetical protein